jgi:hypothetical protein
VSDSSTADKRRLRLSRDNAPELTVWAAVVAVGLFFFYWLRDQPFFYDAAGYMIESKGISDHGLLSKWPYSDIRSYGYPFFLTGALSLARFLHHGQHAGVFLAQWPLFVASAWLATRSLFASRRMRLATFAAIAANPLLVVYTAQGFTESLTLTCVLFCTAALGYASRIRSHRVCGAWLISGAAASSYAVAIRPGSVLLPVGYALAAGGVLFWRRSRDSWSSRIVTGALVIVALVVPLIPQVLINHRHYHSVSPLPTYDIAGLQAESGLTIMRYFSNVAECGGYGVKIANPHPPGEMHVNTLGALKYYAFSWPDGPEAALLHVFSGLDPRPFLIDQRDYGTFYERVLQALTVALVLLAARGFRPAWQGLRNSPSGMRMDAAFLAIVTAVFLCILATSAAEYRFGAIPLITVSLLAVVGATRGWRMSRERWALIAGGYVAALLLWVTFSDLLLSTSPIWKQCS